MNVHHDHHDQLAHIMLSVEVGHASISELTVGVHTSRNWPLRARGLCIILLLPTADATATPYALILPKRAHTCCQYSKPESKCVGEGACP